MSQSFELLPIEERSQQYREMAEATFVKAKRTDDPVIRAQLMSMAKSWHALSQELERGNTDPELSPVVPKTDPNIRTDPGQV